MTNSPPLPAARAQDAEVAEALTQDIALSELLGAKWETHHARPGYEWLRTAPLIEGGMGVTLAVRYPDGEVTRQACRFYHSDPVAFDSLMQEIGRRGLGKRFAHELRCDLLTDDFDDGVLWDCMSAPQSIRAAAALAVLRESQEATT